MRLIDADKLKIDYCRACFRLAFVNDQYSNTCESQCRMQQMIDEAPTVDAAKLACRVGDIVYYIDDELKLSYVYECHICCVRVYEDNEVEYEANVYGYDNCLFDGINFDDEEIGQTIFLTMEEALKRKDEIENERKERNIQTQRKT